MSENASIYETAAASGSQPTAEQPERIWHQGAHNLFDRPAARRSGNSYVVSREALVRAVERMGWHDVVDGLPMPFSPGLAVNALAQVSGLPKVQRIAWDGAVTTHDDYEGPGAYSVVGVEFSSGPTTFRMYAVDRGTDLVIAFMEWWTRPRPEWIVTADVTTTAIAHVEADTEEEARALALVALTSDGTDPADVSIAEVERG
ncbi:hypothetical protein [Kineococcus sp. SYSU DK003]|uniref:hypothetical protein n=1 Tax=Kineococcus sp. SYSU DK003 TaxID=3383124 RepID=UPI003D7EF101